MPKMSDKIVPNCRYGHGDLERVLPEVDKNGEALPFGFTVRRYASLRFEGDLYVCGSCGYTEFFDTAPEDTINSNREAIDAGR